MGRALATSDGITVAANRNVTTIGTGDFFHGDVLNDTSAATAFMPVTRAINYKPVSADAAALSAQASSTDARDIRI